MGYITIAELSTYAPFAELTDPQKQPLIDRATAILDSYMHRSLQVGLYRQRIPLTGGYGHLAYRPVTELITVKARYLDKNDPLRTIWGLAGPLSPAPWENVDISTIDIDTNLGAVCLPYSAYGRYYDEAEIEYKAGYEVIPEDVKHACGLLVTALAQRPGVGVMEETEDEIRVKYGSDSLITPDIDQFIKKYVVATFY